MQSEPFQLEKIDELDGNKNNESGENRSRKNIIQKFFLGPPGEGDRSIYSKTTILKVGFWRSGRCSSKSCLIYC